MRVDAPSATHVQLVGKASTANAVEQNTSRDSRRVAVFSTSLGCNCIQVAKHTLGQQEEMPMVLTSRGDPPDLEKQRAVNWSPD